MTHRHVYRLCAAAAAAALLPVAAHGQARLFIGPSGGVGSYYGPRPGFYGGVSPYTQFSTVPPQAYPGYGYRPGLFQPPAGWSGFASPYTQQRFGPGVMFRQPVPSVPPINPGAAAGPGAPRSRLVYNPLPARPDVSAPAAYAGLVAGAPNFAAGTSSPGAHAALATAALDGAGRQRQAGSPSPEPPRLARARVAVRLPTADAEVWFEGVRMRPGGATRNFVSPPLEGGSKYAYEVRARWLENGEPRAETRTITVQAGGRVEVDFTRPDRRH